MSVDVDICNSALIKLGAERINALTDDNKRARLCQEQYTKIKNRVLRSHPWKFALKRSKLSPIAFTPEFGNENYFEQPLDCIRIVGVMADYDTSKTTEYHYSVEGRRIVSELDSINLKYITSTVLEAYFDEDFKEALACALAHDLCFAINQSGTQKAELFQEYEFWIGQARSHGAMEITVENLEFDTWTGSRL
jgi:hypothetical protein